MQEVPSMTLHTAALAGTVLALVVGAYAVSVSMWIGQSVA